MRLWNNIIEKYPRIGLIILAYVAFVALGIPDGLLGVAWPSIRTDFSVPLDAVGLLFISGLTGYLTSGFLSGPLNARFGVGKVLAASCVITGAGLIGYTLVPEWWMMVSLGVVAGLGAGAIDAGLNTYVAAHYGEGLMQWLHASYGIGVTLGPIIMTVALTAMNSWRAGYNAVAGFQFALAACFILSLRMWSRKDYTTESQGSKRLTDYKTPLSETLRRPRVWLSMFLFFVYVGSEASLGMWAYTLLTESRGIQPKTAGLWASIYWAAFTGGRILAGLYARRAGVNLMVVGSLITALLGTVLLLWNPADAANLIAIASIGFSIGPIFAALMSGTSRRVGVRFAANAIGMQMSAGALGAASIPGLVGVLARQVSLEVIPACLLVLFTGLLALYGLAVKSGLKT